MTELTADRPVQAPAPERELSMTTVFRDDLVRIQVLRRKLNLNSSQELIGFMLDQVTASQEGGK